MTLHQRKALVTAGHVVVGDGDVGRIGHQNSFEVGIGDGEPGYGDVGEAGMMVSIDVDAVR